MTKDQSHIKQSTQPLRLVSWIAAVTLIAGLAVIAGIYFEQNTRITGIEFNGQYYTDEQELVEKIESPVGILADSVNYTKLFSELNTLPYVKDLRVNMTMRGKLSFTVIEHQPIALLVNNSDRSYVAKGGVKLPIIPERAPDVPLVYGFPALFSSDTLKTDAWKEVEEFLTTAKQSNITWNTISEVAWNEYEGVVALSHENGVRLVFGRELYANRLKQWEIFYSEVVSRKGISAFRSIDLRYRNQIVAHEL